MMIGKNDPNKVTDNKEAKLKCLLHYPSAILRDQEATIESSAEALEFKRYRMRIKMDILNPTNE